MRLLLWCLEVLCVLSLETAVSNAFLRRFRRDGEQCVTCAGEECKTRDKSSTCAGLYAVEADGPEKEVAGKLKEAFGEENVAADKLTMCYTLTFKAGDKVGELRDCGPADVCKTLKEKASVLGVTVDGCTDCEKGAKACNNGTEAAPNGSEAPSSAAAGGSEGPSGGTDASQGSETTTTQSTSDEETNGAFRQHEISVYWIWMMGVTLLFTLA